MGAIKKTLMPEAIWVLDTEREVAAARQVPTAEKPAPDQTADCVKYSIVVTTQTNQGKGEKQAAQSQIQNLFNIDSVHKITKNGSTDHGNDSNGWSDSANCGHA